ncbi:branched-chain amino acid ABC transporter permease [Aestuariispira insulae]|uniref:Amino acid/amide ABC transporter membrane protein 2 (HAAT family) n=1 Tax=Aestuariispira insulae TaxID=1461337 RepID=A0A3D9HNK9_9PROT|nr:branched-chain amino acid ABC transporter permease [Aestuariispira insulae]RED51058.1 amino acid/amide ABC transporter membrane protein 2 (HAAT family) [Aestuariispira insulae]
MEGLINFGILFLTMAGIYGILSLGLNVQWGFTGMLNVGIAAFFAVGAYSSAIVTSVGDLPHWGGIGAPMIIGFAAAMIVSGIMAFFVGLITLNLRSDYLAIASIGIAEIIRLVLKNEEWMTGGVNGFTGISGKFNNIFDGGHALLYMIMVMVVLGIAYFLCERAYKSPWGRVQRAIRENEIAARAMGKNSLSFRLQSFVLGSAIMGLGGAVYTHFTGFISPEAFDPLLATFLIWVMLIAGGSGNNKGAILGAFIIWGVWSGTEFITSSILPADMATQGAYLRVLFIGILLQAILLTRPQGLLPENAPQPDKD